MMGCSPRAILLLGTTGSSMLIGISHVVMIVWVQISILRMVLSEKLYEWIMIHARWVACKVPGWGEGLHLTTRFLRLELVTLEFCLCFFCLVIGISTMLFRWKGEDSRYLRWARTLSTRFRSSASSSNVGGTTSFFVALGICNQGC